MHSILKNIFAIILGLLIGGTVNMLLINYSGSIIPYPEGYDNSDMDKMAASIHLLEAKHYIMPFIAHALGTFVGAFVAALISPNYKLRFALCIGVFFLLGGISMIFMIDSPAWFTITDLVFAYIPMGYLGYILAKKINK